jgi:serine protease Do
MTRSRKLSSTIWVVLVLLLGLVVLDRFWPSIVSRTTYAIERGQAQAAQQQLAVASDLSQAFQQVARALRPSVVSVSSVKHVQANRPQTRRFETPDELRQFFGNDDLFERFFEMPSPPGGSEQRGFEQRGLGTGVIVSEDGYVLTNNHVVAGSDEVTVTLSDKRQLTAQVVGTDKPTDIAVVKIDARDLQPAKLGDSSKLEVGQWALAMGSPFGLDQTVTAGIISAVGRSNMGITDYEDFIQTDAAINPGNSGGPLVNLQGEVIGINTAIATRTGSYQGVGFSIPINMARRVMDSIINTGGVTRGYLGAIIQDLTEDLAHSFGYQSIEGVLIGDVVPDGPAAKAGIKAGDIVTSLNGNKVTSASELRNAIAATDPDTQVTLEVFRDGKSQKLTVTVGKLNRDTVPTATATPGKAQTEKLGMSVQDLTPDIAQQLRLDASARGVVVTDLDPNGLAARAGLREGDLIVGVGGQAVKSVMDFRTATKDFDPKAGIRLQVQREGARLFVFLRGH